MRPGRSPALQPEVGAAIPSQVLLPQRPGEALACHPAGAHCAGSRLPRRWAGSESQSSLCWWSDRQAESPQMGTIPACVRTGSRPLEWRGAGSDHAGPRAPGRGRGCTWQGQRGPGQFSAGRESYLRVIRGSLCWRLERSADNAGRVWGDGHSLGHGRNVDALGLPCNRSSEFSESSF